MFMRQNMTVIVFVIGKNLFYIKKSIYFFAFQFISWNKILLG